MKHRKKGTWKNYIFTFEKTELFQRKSLKLRIVINTYKSIGKSITTVDFQGRFPGDRPAYRNTPHGDRPRRQAHASQHATHGDRPRDHDGKPAYRNTTYGDRPRYNTARESCVSNSGFFFEMDQCGEEIGRYHNSVFVLGIKV